jgi:hypothetical protein
VSKIGATLVFEPKRVFAAFKMMSEKVRTQMQTQVHDSTERVADGSRTRVPTSGSASRKAKGRLGPGELRNTIRTDYAEDLLTGYVKAGNGKLGRRVGRRRKGAPNQRVLNAKQAMRRDHSAALRINNAMDRAAGVYAMVVEFGSPGRGLPAQPYLRPSKEAELPTLRRGVGDALRGAIEASKQP